MNRPVTTGSAEGCGAPSSPLRAALVTAVLAAPALLAAYWPACAEALTFDRGRIAAGEVWRLLTCHWAHWSLGHLAWDLLAFVVLIPLCLRASAPRLFATLALSATLIPLAVHLALPEMAQYRGLSGLDSGLFVLLATLLLRRQIAGRAWGGASIFALALAGFGLKLGFELSTGAAVFVEASGFTPVPLAHVVGGLVGIVIGGSGEGRPTLRASRRRQPGCTSSISSFLNRISGVPSA